MNFCKIAHINARSILAGLSEFKETIISNNYDIFMVTETWLDNRVDAGAVDLRGYSLFRADRGGNVRGGGVCIYIMSTMLFERIEVSLNLNCEQIWGYVTIAKKKFCIGAIYRPPNTNIDDFFDSLEENFSNLLPSCDNLICTGDINIDLLDLENINTRKFYALLDIYEFIAAN